MGSNYKMTYDVDLVFCIDATYSMDPVLDQVKQNALNFYQDFQDRMTKKKKTVTSLRIRVIAFRDYLYDKESAMMATSFFKLPEMAKDFEACVKSIIPDGGGDDPEDGLEALAYAMKSDWCTGSSKKRHVVVIWSDEGTHPIGYGKNYEKYPKGMPKSFDELTEWWGSRKMPGLMDEKAKRLVIFAPDKTYWNTIRDNWNNTIHHITDDQDLGLSKVGYDEIMETVCNSI